MLPLVYLGCLDRTAMEMREIVRSIHNEKGQTELKIATTVTLFFRYLPENL